MEADYLAPRDLLSQALSSAANAIFITDEVGHIVWVNDAFCELSGYRLEEAIGNTPAILKSGRQSSAFYAELWQTILKGQVWRGSMVERRKDGSIYSVDETITPLFDGQGNITNFLAVNNDITLRKLEDEKNRYLAYHDVLTGLPNRAFLLDIQHHAISQAKRKGCKLALMFLDLDKFKDINDTFGHQIGDRLLVAVAERLRTATRKGDTVARLGGDEFVIFVNEVIDSAVVERMAHKLLDSISTPFLLEGQRIQTGASIGISMYPTHGEQPEELLKKADKAMYVAKSRGHNNFQFYDASLAEIQDAVDDGAELPKR